MLAGPKCFIQGVIELICIFVLMGKFFEAQREKHQNTLLI